MATIPRPGSAARVTAAILGLAAAAQAQGPSPALLEAVARYRGGDPDVVREAWPDKRLRKDIAELKRWQHRASFPFEAAAMLYTDRDVEERKAGSGREEVLPLPAPLLEAARKILELIPDPERRQRFERPWLLAVALHLYQCGQWPLALRHLDLGLHSYPEDSRFLLARGSLLEEQGVRGLQLVLPAELSAAAPGRRHTAWRLTAESRGEMLQAESCYRRALTADPGLLEARVRLGHVLQWLGRLEKAIPELEPVIAAPEAEPRVRYLAWLFLGAIREAEGRPRDAVPAYQAAIRALPDSQTGYVALSHALRRLGERAASREALGEATARAGRRHDQDPWWNYPWGQSEEADVRLLALRQQAMR